MIKKLSQNGFSVIVPIIAVSVILIIFLTGFLVYSKYQNSKTEQTEPGQLKIGSQNASDKTDINTNPVANTDTRTAWKDLPADLQQAIISTWNEKYKGWESASSANACTLTPKKGDYRVKVIDGKYAYGGVGCNGGAATIWAKVEGNWQFVQSTVFGFSCDVINKYNIPKELIADDGIAKCLDSSNNFVNL